jgi:hypothetical protein
MNFREMSVKTMYYPQIIMSDRKLNVIFVHFNEIKPKINSSNGFFEKTLALSLVCHL